jgi:cytosine deaminase
MLDVASMGLHVGQLSSRADMTWCFDAVTYNSAAIMGLKNYGMVEGQPANMVLLQATDPIEAIRLKATRLMVFREGKVIAQTPASHTKLQLPGRPTLIDPAKTLL